MSNIIPLGARTASTLPIPLSTNYRSLILNAVLSSNIDFDEVELLSEQRWLSLDSYLSHLTDNQTLSELWVALGASPGGDVYPSLLQFGMYMRFKHLKGRIYETSPAVEKAAAELSTGDVTLGDLDLVTGKPVYFHFAPNSSQKFVINDDEFNGIVGAYLQYEETRDGKRLYYLIHDSSSIWNTLSGHILLDNPKVTLEGLSKGLFPHEGSSNQRCFDHVMKLWALWSTHTLSERHYQEHDMIAANDHSTRHRRLQGAYNRVMLDLKCA